MEENENIYDNLRLIKDLNCHFIVEKYQRGFKWDLMQIKELLEDINTFQKKDGFYCLQPVVVTEINDNTYELIDGQQRLTTIFIIIECLKNRIYSMSYVTRTSSEEFLNNINEIEKCLTFSISDDIDEIIDPFLNKQWDLFISDKPTLNNVDNFHFYKAYQFINKWLNENEISSFRDKLLNHTKVIWYEEKLNNKNNKTPEDLFINLNRGRIELAQAELIKALFVLQYNSMSNQENKNSKLYNFADEWNEIENKLQDDLFWYFISNDTSDNIKYNRIDFLFDILKEKKTNNNKLHSYHKYLEEYNSGSELNWEEVKKLFNDFVEWYDDRSIYHLIGYLTCFNFSSVKNILVIYNRLKNKKSFELDLKKLISDKFYKDKKSKEKYGTEYLNYDKPVYVKQILLLYNIITYQQSDFNYRFPFNKYKEQNWSLEHIHAQNAEEFITIKELKDWLEDLTILSESYNRDGQQANFTILEELQVEIKKIPETDIIDKKYKQRITDLKEETDRFFNKDYVDNLSLLDGITNSSLGNLNFRKKREKIIKIDIKGEVLVDGKKVKTFIPIATKNVFLKYYTKNSDEIQMSYWGFSDRRDYVKSIDDTIIEYLNDKSNSEDKNG